MKEKEREKDNKVSLQKLLKSVKWHSEFFFLTGFRASLPKISVFRAKAGKTLLRGGKFERKRRSFRLTVDWTCRNGRPATVYHCRDIETKFKPISPIYCHSS